MNDSKLHPILGIVSLYTNFSLHLRAQEFHETWHVGSRPRNNDIITVQNFVDSAESLLFQLFAFKILQITAESTLFEKL